MVTAHLDEQQISLGVFAVAQSCCEPVLQSSTEQQASYSALTSAAVAQHAVNRFAEQH